MLKTGLLFIFIFGLAACSQPLLQPAAPQTVPKTPAVVEKTTQQGGKATRYLCKDNKIVRIVRTPGNKKRKLNSITLTFEQSTQKLTQSISESGRKFTNIHWHWTERSEYGTLTSAVGDILAEQCVEQR
ncbi:MliC family protein [Necropsobacter massiliensis]|uniref:MliC family protein n=1 Tax=Necropsobacter massiliensis TaxID=1400001 RepID=UPI000595A3D1|nr:MliC family protein [Necropsobacter massiliensis]